MSDVKSLPSPEDLEARQQSLLEWYAGAKRALPWRTESSLYRTVVSEFMCQQTQIETVLPYFARWMKSFPDFQALANADAETVLTHWAGLGYYARARNLHKLAKAIAAMKSIPRTAQEWRKLPGIGPYTAAAICSIQFHEPVAVVDGNVIRVLARVHALEEPFANAQAAGKAVQSLADAFVSNTNPGDHNQALMELGATLCTKHRPSCLLCPLQIGCLGCARGVAAELPRIKRKSTEKRTVHRLWLMRDDSIALTRAPKGSQRLATLFELPLWPGKDGPSNASLRGRRKRGISHQIIEEHIWEPNDQDASAQPLEGSIHWQPISELNKVPLSGPHMRWIKELISSR